MILLIVVGSVALLVGICAWWLVPKWQMRSVRVPDPKDRADIEDNFRKTVGQALGGIFVLLGAGLAYLQFTEQQRNSQQQFTAQQEASRQQFTAQQETARQQLEEQQKASRDLLISNQVSKGFEQLASKDIVMRLGGIYALEGVMNTSEQYHQPVLEALCAFVRDSTGTYTGEGPPATDIQAALTVISRRATIGTMETNRVDLANAHIPQSSLLRADLTAGNLSHANLNGATLAFSNLTGTNLYDALLKGANLNGANLYTTLLQAADLTGATLSYSNLTGVHLNHTNLTGANLSHTNMSGAEASARLNHAILLLRGANLTDANLAGAELQEADSGADLSHASLSRADLTGAKITQAQLDKACGTGAKLDPGLTLKPCALPQ
jgi:uncharacterized protein YjbI with pentapeptide repeats